jgi:hypothetical protein
MPAPSLVDPWFTRGEVAFPATTDLLATQRSFLWCWKAALMDQLTGGSTSGIRNPASIWTCQGSSNAVSAGLDAVDRLGATFTAGNIVRAPTGTAHSWIVLANTALGAWLCLDFSGPTDGVAAVSYARNAFTGGSTTTKPTSTSEVSIGAASVGVAFTMLGVESTFGVTYRFGFSTNQGGEFHVVCNRVGTGIFNGYLNLLRLRDQSPGDTWPLYGTTHFASSGRGAGSMGSMISTSAGGLRTPNGAARAANGGLNQWFFGGTGLDGATIDNLLNEWDAYPLLVRTQDAGQTAYRGRLQDWYAIGTPNVGGGWPALAGQQMMVVNNALIPFGVNVAL